MTSEIEALQLRVDAIRATNSADLAGRAWHALSMVLFEFTRAKTSRTSQDTPIIQRVTSDDVARLLSDRQERHQSHSNPH